MSTATFRIWRGDAQGGEFRDYATEVSEGMVVLDAVNRIQAAQANDLACRWNCKAGKCGSCSAEINGIPKLMCMTRLSDLPLEKPVTVQPMKAFPIIKDLITDVSWNFRVKKKIKPFKPRLPDAPDGTWRMHQEDIDRVQEFRKCIECFLCQDVCHVLRDHHKHEEFIGPRFLVYAAALEMHPLDVADRLAALKDAGGIGYCNITKCCTKVCPEHITITDNAIIRNFEEKIPKAAAMKIPNVITFFGNRKGMPDAEATANCIEGLNRVKAIAESAGVTICVELLNSKVDHKDYQGDHSAFGVAAMKGVASPRVKLLYDIYHMQIMEGDIIRTIRDNAAFIGHFHTGGVPGRHELDGTQELNWHAVAAAIADTGFTGFMAHEFTPTRDPLTSLRQAVETCTV